MNRLIVALALCAMSSRLLAAQPDILGIQLGTTEDVTVQYLKKHQPTMNIRFPQPVIYGALPNEVFRFGLYADWRNPADKYHSENIVISMSGGPKPSRVLHIQRSVELGSSPASVKDVLQSMQEKFGSIGTKITGSEANGYTEWYWSFDEKGTPTTLTGDARAGCGRISWSGFQTSQVENWQIPSRKGCGTILNVLLQYDPGTDLLKGFTMSITNLEHAEARHKVLMAYLTKANDSRISKEEEQARKNKPAL